MEHVLVVDDHSLTRRLWCELLTFANETLDRHYEPAEAASLADALAWIRSHVTPAVALVDLGLGDASGVEAIEALRSAHPTMPIVVATGRTGDEILQNVTELGAHGFVYKGDDISPEALDRVIRQAIFRAESQVALAYNAAELEQLAHDIAHDLKSPVGAISASLSLIARHEALSGRDREILGIARASAAELSHIAHMLAIGAWKADDRRMTNLGTVVHEAVAPLADHISSTQARVSVDPDLPYAWVCPAAARRAFVLILAGALQERPAGGRHSIRVKRGPSDARAAVTEVHDNRGNPGAPSAARIPTAHAPLVAAGDLATNLDDLIAQQGGTLTTRTGQHGIGLVTTIAFPGAAPDDAAAHDEPRRQGSPRDNVAPGTDLHDLSDITPMQAERRTRESLDGDQSSF